MSNNKPTKEMKEYALQEMESLLRNMAVRPIQVYSVKATRLDRQYYLGRTFVDQLIEALKKQYA